MTKQIKPLGFRILVKRSEAKTLQGGILLPESSKDKPLEGEVLSIGEKVDEVKVGDIVVFSPYGGVEVEDASGHLILSQEDVLGVKVAR